jgi:hypothetical protein
MSKETTVVAAYLGITGSKLCKKSGYFEGEFP